MDTTTVLEIIKMLDVRLDTLRAEAYAKPIELDETSWDKSAELMNLRDHLQDYIEAQVSAIENSTGE
jgi:hypothetical protein